MGRLRLLTAGALLCLPAAGLAQTTTVTTSTTTTTVPCTGGSTPASIVAGLGTLQQLVNGATDVGPKARLLKLLGRAQTPAGQASSLSGKKEKAALKRVGSALASFNFAVRSLHGRKTIGSGTRMTLQTCGKGLLMAVKTLQKSL